MSSAASEIETPQSGTTPRVLRCTPVSPNHAPLPANAPRYRSSRQMGTELGEAPPTAGFAQLARSTATPGHRRPIRGPLVPTDHQLHAASCRTALGWDGQEMGPRDGRPPDCFHPPTSSRCGIWDSRSVRSEVEIPCRSHETLSSYGLAELDPAYFGRHRPFVAKTPPTPLCPRPKRRKPPYLLFPHHQNTPDCASTCRPDTPSNATAMPSRSKRIFAVQNLPR